MTNTDDRQKLCSHFVSEGVSDWLGRFSLINHFFYCVTVHKSNTVPDRFLFFFPFHRICSDDDRQMNCAHIKDKESVKCFTYLLLQKSTFIHTVLYRQLKLNVGKLKICPYK